MRFILVFLFCLLFLPTFAETIGNIEYHLPDREAKSWVIGSSLDNPKSTTIIYIPQAVYKQSVKEFLASISIIFLQMYMTLSLSRRACAKCFQVCALIYVCSIKLKIAYFMNGELQKMGWKKCTVVDRCFPHRRALLC